jgi:hypothetical protein
MARADTSEMRSSGPVPPDDKMGRWLPHRAPLIPPDAGSKLRCGGEGMAREKTSNGNEDE